MSDYYLAIDIGASSGRHILGHMEEGRIILEEIYRFGNGMNRKDGHLCWDTEELFNNILEGLKECKIHGKIPKSVAIDTWAVDYVLLDKDNKIYGNTYGYRDARTKGMDKVVSDIISQKDLYDRTGIQKLMFNTIYQLASDDLSDAKMMLMIPDYFNFLLTGNAVSEYTNATTTQLVSPITKDWDWELIEKLGFPQKIFRPISKPGTKIGRLTKEMIENVGFDCDVILPATHDTGSAVVSVPSNEESVLYISSGTWSLMGTELKNADTSDESRIANFTNEGGYDYRFRFLKNIMGLWMIQSVKKEIGGGLSFGQICDAASNESITSIVDCNDDRFLAPDNMTEEVKMACKESGQQIPEGIAQVASVIYSSLAECYAKTAEKIEELTGVKYKSIHIVGGGANADYLNKLTAKATKKTVYAGPVEATAIGNIAVQLIANKELKNLSETRKCIFNSFEIKKY